VTELVEKAPLARPVRQGVRVDLGPVGLLGALQPMMGVTPFQFAGIV
jgi:hypothetical protein